MQRKVLSVHGKMRSGKDTFAAEFLKVATAQGETWKRWGCGDVLRRELSCQVGVSPEVMFRDADQWRQQLIDLGKKRRAEDPFYLVKRVISEPGNLIIPDMRFPNEYNTYREGGAIVMKVWAPDELRAQRGEIILDDVTECALDHIPDGDWDYVIGNDKPLDIFQMMARAVSEIILDRFRAVVETDT